MKYVTKIQTVLSSTKIIGLLIIIIGGLIRLCQGKNSFISGDDTMRMGVGMRSRNGTTHLRSYWSFTFQSTTLIFYMVDFDYG